MDPQTMLIGAAIVVVSALVLYLISVCSMKERTYEEVLEEQRQRKLLETQSTAPKSKTDKEKLKKRYRKGKGGTKVDESPKASGTAAVAVAAGEEDKRRNSKAEKMVELELEPEIIQPVEEPPKVEKPPKKKKEKPAKAILHNKEEKVMIQKTEVQETFHAERGARPVKDELELKHEREKILKAAEEEMERQSAPQPEKMKEKKKKEHRMTEDVIVEPEVVAEQEMMQMQAPPPAAAAPGANRKSKKTKDTSEAAEAEGPSKVGDLVNIVKMAQLNDQEIQNLIELLLNKQGRSAVPPQWTKKSKNGDPVQAMKKQLEEKERLLQETQNSSEQAINRLKEYKTELGTEKQRFAMLQKNSHEKIEMQVEEIKSLHARMQQSHEAHMEESNTLKYQIEQYKSAANQSPLIQRLTEENNQLKDAVQKNQHSAQQVSIMNDELARNVMNLNKSENAKKNLEAQLAQYEERARQMEGGKRDAEAVLNRKLAEVGEALRQSEARNKKLSDDLQEATKGAHGTRQELTNLNNTISNLKAEKAHNVDVMKSLESKLLNSEKTKAESENRHRNVEVKLKQTEEQNKIKDQQLKSLKEEIVALSSELKTTKERTAGEGQEAPAEVAVMVETKQMTVGSAAPKNLTNGDPGVSSEALEQKVKEIAQLREEIEAQKEKNNVLREKNWKVMDALKNAEKQVEASSAKDEQITQLSTQLEEAKKAAIDSQSKATESTKDVDQTRELQAELDKNQKHSETLEKELKSIKTQLAEAEASVKEKAKQSEQSAEERKAELDALKKELESAANQKVEAEFSLDKLKTQLAEKDAKLEQIGKESDRKDTDVKVGLENQIEDMGKRLAEKDQEIEKYRNEIENSTKKQVEVSSSLEQALKDVKGQLEVKCEECNVSVKRIETLESSSKIQSETISSTQEKTNSLAKELEEKNVELSTVRDELEKTKQEAKAAVEGNMKELTEELQKKNEELSSVKQQLETSVSEQTELKVRLEHQVANLTKELEQKINEMEGQSSADSDAKQKLDENINRLNQQLEAKDEELSHAQKDLEAARSEMSEKQKTNEEQLNTLNKQVKFKTEELNTLKQDLETARSDTEEASRNSRAAAERLEAETKKSADMSNLQQSLLAKDAELCKVKQEMTELKRENEDLRVGCEKATATISKAEKSAEEIAQVQKQLKSSVTEVTTLKSTLQSKDKEISSLKSQLESRETVHTETVTTVGSAPKSPVSPTRTTIQGSTIVTRVEERSSFDVSRLVADLDERDAELAILRAVLSQKEQQLQQLQKSQPVSSGVGMGRSISTSSDISVEEVEHKDNELAKLKEIVKDYWMKIESLKDEVYTLEEKLDQQGGGATSGAGDAQSTAEADAKNMQLQQQIKELESSVQSKEQKQAALDKRHRETLQSIFPQVRVNKSLSHAEWLSAFEREVTRYMSSLSSALPDSSPVKQEAATEGASSDVAAGELEEAKQKHAHLQSQISHYQKVLGETENILHKLQNSVEGEEAKWVGKLQNREQELTKAQQQVKQLQEQLSKAQSIPSANGSADVSEMKGKLAETQKKLDTAIATNEQLKQKLESSKNSEDGTSV